ncbi:MAG: glycosyltransferase family 9 protein [bacterium]|nr:glycosyltransferase family 9 protein [bacterium]
MCGENCRTAEFERVLIICGSDVETIVFLFPAIRHIREHYKNSKLDILCSPEAEKIVKETGWFDKVIGYQKPLFFKILRELRKEKYSSTLCFQLSLFIYLVGSRNRFFFLTRRLFSDRFFTHESINFMRLIEPHFGKWKEKQLYYPITEGDRQKARSILHMHNISSSATLIAIHPGNPEMPDRWDPLNYSKVCDTLIEEYDARILLFGESNDKFIKKIISASKHSDRILDMSTRTSPREIVSILEKTSLAITRNGLFLYLVCAAKTPVISIFGAGNPYRYGPLGTKYINVHTDMDCFPCNKKKKCPKSYKCMETIDHESVIDAARLMLNEGKQLFLFE